MDVEDRLIQFLNRTFPESGWERRDNYLILLDYDFDQFCQIVNQQFPPHLWESFVHLGNIFVFEVDYKPLLGWSKHRVPYHFSFPISYQDIDTILQALTKLTTSEHRDAQTKLTKKHLIIYGQFLGDVFLTEMLTTYVTLKKGELTIPLENIPRVIDYLTQTFPVNYPTPLLIADKMMTFLDHLSLEHNLAVTFLSIRILGTKPELDVISGLLPIPLDLETLEPDAVYRYWNSEQIYSRLWEVAVQDQFRRSVSRRALDALTLPELNDLIGEYVSANDEYTQLWQREVFDVSRQEYLREILDLPTDLVEVVVGYV